MPRSGRACNTPPPPQVKLKVATDKIAKADLAHSQAEPGPKKEGLSRQLEALRAVRDGVVGKRAEELYESEAHFQRR